MLFKFQKSFEFLHQPHHEIPQLYARYSTCMIFSHHDQIFGAMVHKTYHIILRAYHHVQYKECLLNKT